MTNARWHLRKPSLHFMDETDKQSDLQVPAAKALVNAMNAVLPGINANDKSQTAACFRLYCCALSCMGQLEVMIPRRMLDKLHNAISLCQHLHWSCLIASTFTHGLL